MEKMPPLEKVYEAYRAIAGGRVTIGEGSAVVRSSGGDKPARWQSENDTTLRIFGGFATRYV